ncbi:MAG: cupin [Oculatellaceae cyanobacterium Prado106]|nr:cupin [Oculatellaceae cyanobacterium Prado106]
MSSPEATMKVRDWLVNAEGQCEARPSAREWGLIRDRYYFHEFLTEIVHLLGNASSEAEEWDYLPQIRTLVRKLITNSYWVQTQYREPDPKVGSSVLVLYDEIGYPLSVQNVVFLPGFVSSIHNHGTWAVVAVFKGQEKHTFWKRNPDNPHQIEQVSEKILNPGEILSFTPDAIHQVEAIGSEPALTFHIYGDTQPRSRFEFDLVRQAAKPF